MMHDDLSTYRSILCLNGNLPPKSFFVSLDLPVIAADGAANALFKLGITPSLIIGDLDSVEPTILKKYPYLHLPDQNTTDFQKSLDYLQNQALLPAVIVGVNGGFLDHVLHNINLFMAAECLLYAPPLKGFVLKAGSACTLELPSNTKISLLGIPKAQLSTEGLKWDLDKTSLSFPGTASCFNRTVSPELSITVHEGSLLVLWYMSEVIDDGCTKVRLCER